MIERFFLKTLTCKKTYKKTYKIIDFVIYAWYNNYIKK